MKCFPNYLSNYPTRGEQNLTPFGNYGRPRTIKMGFTNQLRSTLPADSYSILLFFLSQPPRFPPYGLWPLHNRRGTCLR